MGSSRTFKPLVEVPGIKNGETAKITVPNNQLPAECVLRFDYREKESSTPYPSEKHIFVYKQDLELRVSPVYCNNGDSTKFQDGELENTTFVQFSGENAKRREQLGLLQNFLMNYEDPGSKFYKVAVEEYETRRGDYNAWIKGRALQDKELFVSNLYSFQYIPDIAMRGNETDRILSMIDHYFDGFDFRDPLILKAVEINKWMDNYVNLYGQMAKTTALRDSLFPLAGKRAIEKAKTGDPLVYGWMVDYFYRGYESNAIDAGMKALAPYLDDPNCLTSKRQEIERRLKGMETLVAGSKAPDISLKDAEGNQFELKDFQPETKYTLLMFWSADCSHCMETVNALYPWHQLQENQKAVSVIAISLDETETEVKAWEKKIPSLSGWRHIRGEAGVRSKVAGDYFVLATPVMVLLDAKTHNIVAMPNTINELIKSLQ
jgi:peroxiredoxin